MKYFKIIDFKYNNKDFVMLKDTNNKYFYLIKDTDKFKYPTLTEIVELNKKFMNKAILREVRNNKKMGLVPKILIGSALVPATLTTMLFIDSFVKVIKAERDYYNSISYEDSANIVDIDNEEFVIIDDSIVHEGDTPIEVQTYIQSDTLNYLYVYDFDYLDMIFGDTSVTREDLVNSLNSNNNISARFKEMIIEYIDNTYRVNPSIDFRVFNENLKTLKVIECDQYELAAQSLSMHSSGVYIKDVNEIYVLDTADYESKGWDYQVIMHEFTHVAESYRTVIDGRDIVVSSSPDSGIGVINEEALVSIYAVRTYSDTERDIAYQLQSNYHSILMDCLDNYELGDIIQHDLTYYQSKLDEHNGDINYANYIFELINAQYTDYYDDDIVVEQSEFYPIYDYISNMYYDKYIVDGMSSEEIRAVADSLVEKIMYDVPEEYNIDTERFYFNFINSENRKIERSR